MFDLVVAIATLEKQERGRLLLVNYIKFICNASKEETCQMDEDDWKFPEKQHFLSNKNVTERIKNEPNCYRDVGKQFLRAHGANRHSFPVETRTETEPTNGQNTAPERGLTSFCLFWPDLDWLRSTGSGVINNC